MNDRIGVVFIHGAGLKGEVWQMTSQYVDAPSLFIDLPMRSGKDEERCKLTFLDYCAEAIRQIEDWPVRRFIIVAHSIGGAIALRLAEDLKDRVAGLIAVSASIPRGGGSFLSSLPLLKRMIFTVLMRLAGTKPPGSAIRSGSCNDLSPAQSDSVVDGYVPEAKRLYFDRTNAPIPAIPKYYIKLMQDQEFTPEIQDRMAANLAANRVIELQAGHLPMLSNPAGLGAILQGLLNQFSRSQGSNT
ncbi:alpha/beta fold hydrolase [Paenibacillus sp. NPDC057967]|uniref:alpha/beta fold hydrolase n=1 Tax=Paenibacillus sp. NPDC057967 TaxID=3346293 RepID=UPI0036DD9E53